MQRNKTVIESQPKRIVKVDKKTGTTEVYTERKVSIQEQDQRTFRQREPGAFGILTSFTTYLIIFLLLIFGSSITLYQREPDKYSWLDLNDKGEIVGFKEETYDVTITYNLDTPLDDLNGNSLNDVFSVSSLTPGSWFTYSATVTSNQDNIVQWTSTGYSIFSLLRNLYNGDITAGIGDYFYVNGSMRSLSSNVSRLRIEKIGSVYVVKDNPVIDVWYDYSFKNIAVDTDSEEFRATALLSQAVSGSIAEIEIPLIINMTDLGIDNLTKDQMDYWYSEYQRLQENRIEDMKLLGSEVVSSWYTTTEILKSIGDAVESVYNASPLGLILNWILDIAI